MTTDRYEGVAQAPENGVYGHIGGVAVTDNVVVRLSKNAEEGFPGATPRGPGHPLVIADEPTVVVQFRLPPSKLAALDAKAKAVKTTRSALLRNAVDLELATATGAL